MSQNLSCPSEPQTAPVSKVRVDVCAHPIGLANLLQLHGALTNKLTVYGHYTYNIKYNAYIYACLYCQQLVDSCIRLSVCSAA